MIGAWLCASALVLVEPATVAVGSFGDRPEAVALERALVAELEARGLEAHRRGDPEQASFVVQGELEPSPAGTRLRVVVRERGVEAPLASLSARWGEGELLLPIVLPQRVARAIAERLDPPPPPTEEELEILARLDDDPPPPEDPCLTGCCYPDVEWPRTAELDPPRVDLREDFPAFCRVSPRRARRSRGEPVDWRPACIRGPVLGYVRPRTWIAGSATVLAAAATGLSFGLHARGWDEGGLQWGQHRRGAPLTTWGTTSAVLTGALLSTTIALVFADRRGAKRYLRQEKRLRSLR